MTQAYLRRDAEVALARAMARSPVVAILGPRQCGKSTLARAFLRDKRALFLDLQDRVDVAKLTEPELLFETYRSQVICLDEIQRVPDFFSVLRSEVDRDRRPGRFLILGSASRDLIQQSAESLAGRIAYLDLTPFLLTEVEGVTTWAQAWLRGGFPDSLLAFDDEASLAWRRDFIRTFLERDIPSLGLTVPIPVMERLWRLLAHYHGQTVNYSKLAAAADISVPSLKRYMGILEQTYMVRLLSAHTANLKKRMIKSPKIYLRDSGILHALHEIETFADLLGSPISGASWEGFALENILISHPHWRPSYARTSNGAEVDLVLSKGDRTRLFEFKASKAPKPSRGFYELLDALNPEVAWVVAPVDMPYPLKRGVWVTDPLSIMRGDPRPGRSA